MRPGRSHRQSTLNRLPALLEDSDAGAVELAERITSRIGSDQARARFQSITRQVDDFEFDDVLALLRDFRAEWKRPGETERV